MNKSRALASPLLCCILTLLASCAQIHRSKPAAAENNTPDASTPADGPILKLAQIESVQAEISPTRPTEAVAVIHGLLHDGATRVHEVQQQRLADGIVLTVITARSRNAVATLALIPFERSVNLNLQGMPKGRAKSLQTGWRRRW